MLKISSFMARCFVVAVASCAMAQNSSHPGNWKTFVIPSGADHGVPPPPGAEATAEELAWLKVAVAETNPAIAQQVRFWDAGPPSYRWMDIVTQRQIAGQPLGASPFRAYSYVAMAIYDATIAASNAKETYKRPRPVFSTSSVQPRVRVPESYSYPSEHAATAAAAAAVLSYLVPAQASHFEKLAEEAGKSRLYAGVEYPTDYLAGLELGKRVAAQVIAKARADGSDIPWSGVVPTGPCNWTGANPVNAAAANWKPILLSTPSEFRPAPPPPCDSAEVQADLQMVRNYPRALTGPNFANNARAFYWQTNEGVGPWAFVNLNRWVLEDQLERDPARAARAFALLGIAANDSFIASQDAKYTYWYLRPAQLDSSLVPLFPAPGHPSYPSNHSAFSSARAEVLAYLFPERAEFIRALAKEAGDSRIWAGIHYEMDNRAGVELGHKVAEKIIAWAQNDGCAGQ
jgi:membrane-associated phospholipid phosphatase